MLSRSHFSSDEEYRSALRDYFAGKAMEGALSSPRTFAAVGSEDQFDKVLCERVYQVADAMLAARKASA